MMVSFVKKEMIFCRKKASKRLKKVLVIEKDLWYNLKMTVSMGKYILSHIAIKKKEESDAKELTYKEEIQNEFTDGEIRAQYG